MKIVKLYEVSYPDGFGVRDNGTGEYYRNRIAAEIECMKTYSKPIVHDAIMGDDNEFYLLKSINPVYTITMDDIRLKEIHRQTLINNALSKLTNEELEAIGFKPI